jgi:hypothetical protein
LHVDASVAQLESVPVSAPESPPLLLLPEELLDVPPLLELPLPLLLLVVLSPPASGVGLLPLVSSPHATTVVQARRLAAASVRTFLCAFIS